MGIGFGFDTFGDPKFIDHKHYLDQVPKEILNDAGVISSPHNEWLGMMVRTGLVGFCLFFAIYIRALNMSFRLITASENDEANMWGRVGGACLVAIGIYGFFNVVSMHFLEMLVCVSFFVISNSYKRNFRLLQA
jgi:O-antigen ligase